MFKEYDPNIKPKHEPIPAEVSLITFTQQGMIGNSYPGHLVADDGVLTITFKTLGISVAAKIDDLEKAIAMSK